MFNMGIILYSLLLYHCHSAKTIQKLVPGVLLLGAVLEIHEYEVLVSLPFNMRGSVAIADVSDHMTKLLESEAEKLDTEDEEVSVLTNVLQV